MKAFVGRALNQEELDSRVPKDRKGKIADVLDRALAFRFDPSETLVISGFWRSGTTWLEEALRDILCAKTLFEPIDPLLRDAQDLYEHNGVSGKTHEFLRLYMPFCNDALGKNPLLHRLFARALHSTSRGAWARRFRKGLGESLRSRVVVKFVNAQLCLRAAQNAFAMPVLHVYRDPRAVIASIKKTRWHWLFDHLHLREQLLDLPDGRAEYFNPWRDEILDYDRYDTTTRIAAYWAFTEKFLQSSYANYDGRFVCLSYERLALQREKAFAEILRKLNLQPWRERFAVSAHDSTTTSNKQRGATVQARVAGWQEYLSAREIAAIENVVQHLGFAERLCDPQAAAPGENVEDHAAVL